VLDELQPDDFVLMQLGHNDGGELFAGDRPRASLKGTGEESVTGTEQCSASTWPQPHSPPSPLPELFLMVESPIR
jgi:lysophospholipase L1-like esterase